MNSGLPEFENWELVAREWNRVQGSYLQIRESDLLWNLTRQALVHYRFTRLANTPVLYGVASSEGLTAGLSERSLWLSLWGEIPTGQEDNFISELLDLTRREGKSRCSIGADEFHFVSGVPLDSEANERLLNSLAKNDFKITEACDLVGDIESESVSKYIDEALQNSQKEGWQLRPALSDVEKDELLNFLTTEFPGRWTREFEFFLKSEETKRAIWSSLRNQNNQIVGFARIAVRNRFLPADEGWTPGALRLPLQPNRDFAWSLTDGCLGPIGVAASQRGKGTGRILLGLTLNSLRANQAKLTCIDWTDAMKYYQPLQFKVARRYGTAWRALVS